MIILTIRTDKPKAELGLYENDKQLAYKKWQAHRKLAETIHLAIKELLQSQSKEWHDLEGIACFKGPGSFTGLRIGLTVANASAANLNIPIVSGEGEHWQERAIEKLLKNQNEKIALPNYGHEAHITKPRK
jgi:tRNA threonylcarbamoyladenosine biosynthesis protein TsaB